MLFKISRRKERVHCNEKGQRKRSPQSKRCSTRSARARTHTRAFPTPRPSTQAHQILHGQAGGHCNNGVALARSPLSILGQEGSMRLLPLLQPSPPRCLLCLQGPQQHGCLLLFLEHQARGLRCAARAAPPLLLLLLLLPRRLSAAPRCPRAAPPLATPAPFTPAAAAAAGAGAGAVYLALGRGATGSPVQAGQRHVSMSSEPLRAPSRLACTVGIPTQSG